MEPKIIKMSGLKIVGCASYGENIHELWEIFMKHEKQIKYANLNVGYEIHIFSSENEVKQKTHIMVGVAVEKIEDIPIETVAKIIPANTYAVFTHKLIDGGYKGSNELMDKWLEESLYKLALPISIQVFDERFKGSDNPDSEIDFYLPIIAK